MDEIVGYFINGAPYCSLCAERVTTSVDEDFIDPIFFDDEEAGYLSCLKCGEPLLKDYDPFPFEED